MFISFAIEIDNFSKDSLNVTMACIYMPCLYIFTRYLYISKEIMAKTTTPYFGSYRSGNQRQPYYATLYAFMG